MQPFNQDRYIQFKADNSDLIATLRDHMEALVAMRVRIQSLLHVPRGVERQDHIRNHVTDPETQIVAEHFLEDWEQLKANASAHFIVRNNTETAVNKLEAEVLALAKQKVKPTQLMHQTTTQLCATELGNDLRHKEPRKVTKRTFPASAPGEPWRG